MCQPRQLRQTPLGTRSHHRHGPELPGSSGLSRGARNLDFYVKSDFSELATGSNSFEAPCSAKPNMSAGGICPGARLPVVGEITLRGRHPVTKTGGGGTELARGLSARLGSQAFPGTMGAGVARRADPGRRSRAGPVQGCRSAWGLAEDKWPDTCSG